MTRIGTRVDAKSLRAFMSQVFIQMGLPPQDAETGADLLVWCNLRGVDSHGVQRIASFIRRLDNGSLNPNPNIQILKETPAVLFIDADLGLGAVTASYGMRRAMEKAKNVGIGWTLVFPPQSLRVDRDGVPHFTPEVEHMITGEPVSMNELIKHYRGD